MPGTAPTLSKEITQLASAGSCASGEDGLAVIVAVESPRVRAPRTASITRETLPDCDSATTKAPSGAPSRTDVMNVIAGTASTGTGIIRSHA